MPVDEHSVSEESPWGPISLVAVVAEFPAGVPARGFVAARVCPIWAVGEGVGDPVVDEVGWVAEVDLGPLASSRAGAG